ncbi:rhamnan synthesis F family protein [Variovorax sp. RHLX14]|uniref:rhamnan synthesis F family protein n=1 Tax=Variovorax sp. RHLX14 TaxID=1259731 RepID=UPI003F48D7D8
MASDPELTSAENRALFPEALKVDAETALLNSILALQRAQEEALQAHIVSAQFSAVSTELEVQRAEVRRLSAEIEAVRFSVSWRLTAPVRHLFASFPWLGKGLRAVASGLRAFLDQGHLDNGAAPGDSSKLSSSTSVGTTCAPPAELFRDPSTDASIALPLSFAPTLQHDETRIAAIIHLENADFANECRRYLDCIDEKIDVYISTSSVFHAAQLEMLFQGFSGGKVDVRVADNSGGEGVCRLTTFKNVYAEYTYILYLHGLRTDAALQGAPWRQFLLETLVGNGSSARYILSLMDKAPDLGMVGVQHFEPKRQQLGWGESFQIGQLLARQMGIALNHSSKLDFPSGSMFWARSAALAPLLKLKLTADDFENLDGLASASASQAIERIYYFICEKAGFRWLKVAQVEFYKNTPRIDFVETPAMLKEWIDANFLSLLAPDEPRSHFEKQTAVAHPTNALITRIQRHSSGHCTRLFEAEVKKRVAIGLSIRNHSRIDVRRAIDAAKTSFSNCLEVAATSIYIPRSAAKIIDLTLKNSSVEVIDEISGIGEAAIHNSMMKAAFSNGASHYVALNPEGVMHPSAATALIRVLAANHDKALVEAIRFPEADPEPYGVFDFEVASMSGECMMVSRVAYELLGGFDEQLSDPFAAADLSWRARAAGLSLKRCPHALFLLARKKHFIAEANVSEEIERRRSTIYLARKWGQSQESEHFASKQSSAMGIDLASIDPVVVPSEWFPYADVDNLGRFASYVGPRDE